MSSELKPCPYLELAYEMAIHIQNNPKMHEVGNWRLLQGYILEKLNAATAQHPAVEARNTALEEAAKLCDMLRIQEGEDHGFGDKCHGMLLCAVNIRALTSQSTAVTDVDLIQNIVDEIQLTCLNGMDNFHAFDFKRAHQIIKAALTSQPTAVEDLKEDTNGHDWFLPKMIGHKCCRKCGIVKRLDGKNSPCKGNVRVGIRDEYTEEALISQTPAETSEKPKWACSIKGSDKDGWKWEVEWPDGEVVRCHTKSFEEANNSLGVAIKGSEKP